MVHRRKNVVAWQESFFFSDSKLDIKIVAHMEVTFRYLFRY